MKILPLVVFAFLLSGCPRMQYHARVDDMNAPSFHRRHPIRPLSADGILIEVNGPTPYERERIRGLASSLNFVGQPMPGWWRITILNRPDWDEALARYGLEGQTYSAFTVLGQNQTFVNEEYLFFASTERVRFTLAHEAAHLICSCASEDKANQIARILIKK